MEQQDRQIARYLRLQAASDSDLPALTVARARRYLKNYPDHGPAWMILGIALTDLARYDEGRRALKRALRLCPADERRIPLAQLGHHHETRGDFEGAADWYRRSIKADPEHADGHLFLGSVLARAGELEDAEAALRAAAMCPRGCRDEAHLNLGLVLRAQGRLVEAIECFHEALEIDPEYGEAREALRDVRRTIKYLGRKRA